MMNMPDVYNEDSHLDLSRAYRERKEYALALKELEAVLGHNPSNAHAHLELAYVYREMKDYDKAIEEFKKALEFGFDISTTMEVHLELGRVYSERKESGLALKELKLVLGHNPSNAHTHLELAYVYREMKDYDKAIEEFKKTLEFGLDNENIRLALSGVYREKKEPDLAIQELQLALSRNFYNERLHFELGQIYREVKKYGLSFHELNKAMELGFDKSDVHFELGRIYNEKEEYAVAIKEFKTALTYNPAKSWIHLELEQIYRAIEDYDSALEELKQALACGLDDENIHRILAEIYLKQGKYDLALKEFKTCLKLNPDDARVHSRLGLFYKKIYKDYKLAIKEFQEAINKGIGGENVHIELAEIYLKQEEYALAERECQTALRINPESGLANVLLSLVYENKKEYRLALEELRKAMREGFNEDCVYKGISRIFRKQQITQQFEKFIDTDNKDEENVQGIITEYIFQEGFSSFIKKLEDIIKTNPGCLRARNELAWIYIWKKQPEPAAGELKKIGEIISLSNKRIHIKSVLDYLYKKNYDLALKKFEKTFPIYSIFNNKNIPLKEEFISTLKDMFADRAEEIGGLIKSLPKIHSLYNWRYPAMTKVEGELLYLIVRLLKPEVIVEAGTWMGISTSYLAKGCCDNKKGKVITVDKQEDVWYAISEDLLSYIEFYKKADIEETLPKICNKEGKIDMFFHDSNNSCELLRWEIEEILPFIAKGGLIMVHDILNFYDNPGDGVARFFNEIKNKVKYYSFNTEKGIGVIKDFERLKLKP